MNHPKIESFKDGAGQLFWADGAGDTLTEVFTPAGSYFVASCDVLDRVGAHNKAELVDSLRNPFVVLFWGSHPDDGNDDCFSGETFSSAVPAIEAFQEECFDGSVAYVEIDGPGIHQMRANPHYDARERTRDDSEERSERAMQAGMAFGCDGYNDEMGYS